VAASRRGLGTRVAADQVDDAGRVELADVRQPETSDDVRLAEAFRILQREQISVLSLDVFDTLVWRIVPEPVDAFLLLGQRLHDLGHLSPDVPVALFARLRERAERRARSRVGAGQVPEVSLEAVYDEMPAHLFTGLGPDALAGHEVALEASIVFPDLDVAHLARHAQEEHGARIVLVSDTYLSPAQLRKVVDCETVADLAIAEVFTSSRHKINKSTGLFDVMLDTMKVEPGEVLHVGDHPDADVAAAERAGIHVVDFEKVPERVRAVLQAEAVVRTGDRDTSVAPVDPHCGDLGLTALRAKSLHRAGTSDAGAIGAYWRFGSAVMGPVFTGFAEWVHRRAQAEGITTVHCLMREGEFLSRLLNGARHYLGSDVTAVPLWLSRSVCSRASIFEASVEELAAFLQRRKAPTVRGLCETLGIGLAQVPELFDQADGSLDDAELRRRTLSALAGHPEVRAAIVATSAELRQRLVDYVLTTVGRDTERVLLVDLGWGGTIQAHLDRALAGGGSDLETLGLYLLTNDAAADRRLDGVRTEGFLASGGLPERAVRWVIRSPEIIEQICMHDEGSLQGFTAEGEPVLGETSQSPVQMLQRNAVQRGILQFQHSWARYSEVVPTSQRMLDERARDLLLRMVLRFVVAPTPEEASLFGSWFHDENYGSGSHEPVVVDDLARSLPYMTPGQFLDLPMTRVYWPFGLAAQYNPPLASAAAAIAAGVLEAHALDGLERGEARVEVDLGAGFPPDGGRVIGVNGTGLRFVRDDVWAQPIRGVKVVLGDGPGTARIDFMRLAVSLRGRADAVEVDIEWPEQFDQVRYEDGARLAPNLLFGGRRAPAVVYRCPPEWGDDAYRVEVEVAYAWLPTAPVATGRVPRSAVARELGRKAARRVAVRLRSAWRSAEQVAGAQAGPEELGS
jgi:FMN phosphatase YigB (HAD superfamily)